LRFTQSVLFGLSTWLGIISGFDLWTPAFALMLNLTGTSLFLLKKYKKFFLLFFKNQTEKISWKKEIWPLQWKMALSFFSGFILFSFYNPLIFYFFGPVVAGQVGMSMTALNGLTNLCITWTQVYTPQFGSLVSKNQRQELDKLFFKSLIMTCCTALFFSLSASAMIRWMHTFSWSIANRFLPLNLFNLFIIGNFFVITGFPFGIYMRAHKQEPLALPSFILAVVTIAATIYAAKNHSLFVISSIYALAYASGTLISFVIWVRFRKEKTRYALSLKENNS
jgi:O-antigen/teichoic acid export membrane protein